jgi:hypothetical protein
MPPNDLPFLLDATDALPNVGWPPELLDSEPETCHCLPHGHELPCGLCDRTATTSIRGVRP